MSDASSIRNATTLPVATGRNKTAIRFDSTNNRAAVADGTDWVVLGRVNAGWTQTVAVLPTTLAFFTAPAACKVLALKEVHAVAGSSGSAVTLAVTKDTGTNAPGAGTTIHSGTANLKGTANTVQTLTLSTTAATVTLAAGDRLAIKVTGTLTAVEGVQVTALIEYLG